ncbi:MAG: hypothetical protein SWH68_10235 [Thermodesulfobacteriota bacterium]|nr:hypothetical protein [Thermodesulfobacteriota bacterium]
MKKESKDVLRKEIILKKILIFIVLVLPSISFAAPVITSVEGTVSNGQQLTITGCGFGSSGPDVILFDDFSDGTDGETVPDNAVIGSWDSKSKGVITYADNLLSNGKGARGVGSSGQLSNRVLFGDNYSEVFVSSIAYVPDGYSFPSASAEETMPTVSALKHFWVMYDTGYLYKIEPDIVAPTWVGGKFYTVASNDAPISTFDTNGDVSWVWDEPVRWSLWMKGNGDQASGSDGAFQAVSSDGQINKRYSDYKAWFNSDHSVFAWDRMVIPGYVVSSSTYPTHNYVIDDVYVAVGPNANVRVEIGNESDYTACTKMAICTPNSWSDTDVVATVREGTFNTGDVVYLFIVDKDETPSTGTEIVFGADIDMDTSIQPPTNLDVQAD